MLNREHVRSLLRTIAPQFTPKNCREYRFQVFDGVPREANGLGFIPDQKPCEGKVVHINDTCFIVKTGRAEFCVVDKALATQHPAVGQVVCVTPYARRDFNKRRIDMPNEEIKTMSDGTQYTIKTMVLGGSVTHLPIPAPQCPELAQLKQQLEYMPAPDGFRKLTHLLVDANAQEFSIVDPTPENIFATPPAICCLVSTTKFTGRLAILYDRGSDTYVIELWRGDELWRRVEEVHFDELSVQLSALVDDELWIRIQVEVLFGMGSKRVH